MSVTAGPNQQARARLSCRADHLGSVLCLIAVLLSMAGCAAVQPVATAPEAGDGIPPIAVEGARPSPLPLPAQLLLPPGSGLHPVVILLHGCGGVSANTRAWAVRLRDWGYGSVIVNSLQPRGVTSVCAPDRQPLVTRFDRAGDAIAAARWLQTQPGVDGKRVAVIGESHGGGTAATVVNRPFAQAAEGQIKAAVDYYGPCRVPALYSGMPLLALAGDADTWGYPARTCTAYRDALPPGSPVTVSVYPGAVHAFDNPRVVQRRFEEGHPMQYDPEAATDSFERVHAFLDRTIGPGG